MIRYFLFLLVWPAFLGAQNDFVTVKNRVVTEIVKTKVADERVERILSQQLADGTWPNINYVDTSRTGFQHRDHLANTLLLNLALVNPTSIYYRNSAVTEAIEKSLRHWAERDYQCANWWHNQVGTPMLLVDILLLNEGIRGEVRERLLEIADRGKLDAPGARPGGDRIKIGGIMAKRQLATGDSVGFAHVMRVINDEIHFNTGNRGLQRDMSFHHRVDRVNNTTSYGKSYASVFAEWAAYVSGTRYAFREKEMNLLVDYYLDGICKQMVYGAYSDPNVRNRDISRRRSFRPASTRTLERLLASTDYRADEMHDLLARRRGENVPPPAFAKYFWQTEHYVHQRPNYYASVRLYSDRNRNMEYPYNSEGLTNHYRGDGALFLSLKGNEYEGIWPCYDWEKIPGTTVLQRDSMPSRDQIRLRGLTYFVGGVADGQYGAVAMDLINPHIFTRARKSWFFFDEEYVCLGAGIESLEDFSVATTVEQSLWRGAVTVANDSSTVEVQTGEHEIDGSRWVMHNGVGYLFPEGGNLRLSLASKRGSWRTINEQWNSPADSIEKNVFTLWFDHGDHPQGRRGGFSHDDMTPKDVTYAYVVVPRAGTPDKLEADRGIRILANERDRQAVWHEGLGILQAVFFAAGSIRTKDVELSIDHPGTVMWRYENGRIESLSVSDPSRQLSRMHFRLSGDHSALAREDHYFRYEPADGVTYCSVKLPEGEMTGSTLVLRP